MTVTSSHGAPTSSAAAVNRTISQLAHKYCVDCRTLFDDLSRIIQKVIASRKELVEYDRKIREAALKTAFPARANSQPGQVHGVRTQISQESLFMSAEQTKDSRKADHETRCYGCTTATVEHCVTLLRALATNSVMRAELCQGVSASNLCSFSSVCQSSSSIRVVPGRSH